MRVEPSTIPPAEMTARSIAGGSPQIAVEIIFLKIILCNIFCRYLFSDISFRKGLTIFITLRLS